VKRFRLYKQSLSKQLLTSLALLLATIGITIVGLSYHLTQDSLHKQGHEQVLSITRTLEFATEGPIELGYTSMVQRIVENYATLPTIVEIAIVSPDYRILAHNDQNQKNQRYTDLHPELAAKLIKAANSGIETSFEATLNEKSVIVQILPFSSTLFEETGQRGLAITISDLKQIQQEIWRTFLTSTITMSVGMFVILLLMASLIQQTTLSPLNRLNRAVMSSQKTGRFIPPSSSVSNEINFLAATFNHVFEQHQHVEISLRESEQRERKKAQQIQSELVERRQIETQLRHSLEEKDVLLKEVHHRVKNNMQIISSLLKLQAESIQDPKVLKPFIESQQRIRAIALIHEKLYQANNLAKINFSEYARQLAEDLLQVFGTSRSHIRLSIDVAEIEMTVDTAIPCGLIINELISNALKYAFPEGRIGEIHLNFVADTSPNCDRYFFILSISDNGIGIPADIDFENTESLGLQLVHALTQQLQGEIKLDLTSGTRFEIILPLIEPAIRNSLVK
jgi:two-component sensor histidine kinase